MLVAAPVADSLKLEDDRVQTDELKRLGPLSIAILTSSGRRGV